MKSFVKSVISTTIGMVIGSLLSLLLLILIVMAISKGVQRGTMEPIQDKSILHLRLRGSIVEKHRPLDFDFLSAPGLLENERTMGLYELNKAIDLAKDDKRFSGLYLEIRDFDAGWATVTALRRHLADFAKSGKWVYAYADRYDEKGYYLATAANQIFIQPHGDIEFNGLAVNEAFLKGLFDKLNLEPRIFRVGKFKAAIEPLVREKMSEENRLQTQDLINDIWSTARAAISTQTKKPETRIDEIATKLEATSAEKAKETGLIHELMFEDQVESLMATNSVGKDKDPELVSVGQLLKDKGDTGHKASGKGKKIAVIFAEGEITSGTGSRDSIGSEGLRADIMDAREDEDVAAVVLRVNSPGGDALASDVIWREVRVTDDEIPVVVSMGDLAASGGYYIASGGRYIFAEPTTITGSIGVFGVMFNTEKFFRTKTGVSFDRVVTHPSADLGDPNRPMTSEEAEVIQHDVERVYKRFLDVVQESRGYEKRSDLESIAEGRVWSGTRAKEIGLVDELGGLDQAIAKAAELSGLGKDYEVDLYPKEQDPLLRLLEQFSGDVMSRWMGVESLADLRAFTKGLSVLKKLPKSGVQMRMLYDLNIH